MSRRRGLPWIVVCSALVLGPAQGWAEPSAGAIKERWQRRLDGRHFGARVRMEITNGTDREERIFEVWRDHSAARGERLLARFESPPDLRGMALLYLENESGPNDYFVHQPTTGRTRRVPSAVVREDVYGVDLEYLGFGLAQIEPTRLESAEAVSLEGRPAFRLVERAVARDARFEERRVWLDAETFVPLRTEHMRGGAKTLVARTEEVRLFGGVPTPCRVVFERPLERQTVRMTVDSADFESPIPESSFSLLQLLKR
jgi:hypothetical protein